MTDHDLEPAEPEQEWNLHPELITDPENPNTRWVDASGPYPSKAAALNRLYALAAQDQRIVAAQVVRVVDGSKVEEHRAEIRVRDAQQTDIATNQPPQTHPHIRSST